MTLRNLFLKKTPKDKESGLPKKYVAGLTPSQKQKQVKAIKETKKIYEKTGEVKTRPKVSDTSKRSSHVINFENKYGFKISDMSKVKKTFPNTDINTILSKGRGAYASGSRPNQTPTSWAYARLASVLTGGKALKVDKDLIGERDLKKILC